MTTKYDKQLRWLAALVNAGVAISFLVYFASNSSPCMVVYSFRQELANTVVANPFYASSGMLGNPSGDSGQGKTAGDIFLFPNFIRSEIDDAGFLPVRPTKQVGPLLNGEASFSYSYGNDALVTWSPTDPNNIMLTVPQDSPRAHVIDKATQFAKDSVARPFSAGSHVPNVFRCLKAMKGENAKPADYEEALAKLEQSSAMRGACLLSGLQQTVDVTSNYRTSPVPFSSVNPAFFVVLACWIAASFSVVGLPIAGTRIDDALTVTKCGWDGTDFLFSVVSFFWNFGLVVALCLPCVREALHIPVNNAAIGVIMLFAAIALQTWVGNIEQEEEKEQSSNQEMTKPLLNNGSKNVSDGTQPMPGGPVNSASMLCDPSLFLSAASGNDVENGARARKMSAVHRGEGGDSWESSHARVTIGKQLVRAHFMDRFIRDEQKYPGNREALQHLEFALSIPLLYTGLVCVGFSGMPTAFVQILFIMMFVSHMIAAPIVGMLDDTKADAGVLQALMQRGPLIVAFFLMQFFSMFSLFLMLSYNPALPEIFVIAKYLMFGIQILFFILLSILVIVWKSKILLGGIVSSSDAFAVLAFALRLVLAFLIIIGSTSNKQAGIFSCSTSS